MSRQLDALVQELEINPAEGLLEPRLWVKRLVIWKEPNQDPIRDISFRPGLNIIWTPDDDGIGHGGGKTLFCRLLRYCLGEARFAPEDQRENIGSVFPNGLVGAEVMLDGIPWAIIRRLGIRRCHIAVPDQSLEELIAEDLTGTGIEPFIQAVEAAILTPELEQLIPNRRQNNQNWPIALAWLTRDQECRFDHVLDWRSSLSDSDSPARGLTKTELLDALRAFVQAVTSEEQNLRAKAAEQEEERRKLEQELSHQNWQTVRLKANLSKELKIAEETFGEGPIGISLLREAAKSNLANIAGIQSNESSTELASAKQQYEVARNKASELESEVRTLEGKVPLIKEMLAQIQGEYPGLKYRADEAENFPCPICEVPIDQVLASQCNLSHEIPNLENCRTRLENNRRKYGEQNNRLSQVENDLKSAKKNLATAQKISTEKKQALDHLENLQDQRRKEWYAATKLIDDVEDLSSLTDQKQKTDEKLDRVLKAIEVTRNQISAHVDRQANAISLLATKFDPIIRRLVKQDAKGSIRLTGKGLELKVQMGGDRSTSAIDSLKVVAFDLAALCLSIEGKTKVPAFLLHDSPREADLGLSVYHNLFHLIHWLESVGPQPQFQYIITTTTRPPKELSKEPWLRLTLAGSPASKRLMQHDL